MTIADARAKCKTLLERVPRDVLILAVLVLASSASFGLGFLAGSERAGPSTGSEQGSALSITPSPLVEQSPAASSTGIVGSKNGTKYYLPGCAGAARISDANKVFFDSASEAEAMGYQLASGCRAP
jgi:hypothetical protein